MARTEVSASVRTELDGTHNVQVSNGRSLRWQAMKRTGLETRQRTRRGSTLLWSIAASALVALAMLRGMSPSETPEAIPPASSLLPLRGATASGHASAAQPALDAQQIEVRPIVAPPPAPAATVAAELPTSRALNPRVEPEALSFDYPGIAADLLHFVKLAPDGGGGFVVQHVDPDSVYRELGLQAGDVIYSVDPPPDASPDIAFLRAEIKLEVFRHGQSVWLSHKPDQPAATAESPGG